MKIEYTSVSFVEPEGLALNQFEKFEKILAHDPYFRIDNIDESSYARFKKDLFIILYSFIGIVVFLLVGSILSWEKISIGVGALSTIVLLSTAYKCSLQSSSYNKYLQEKNYYYLRMKFCILISENFSEYYFNFYDNHSDEFYKDFKQWKSKHGKVPTESITRTTKQVVKFNDDPYSTFTERKSNRS